MGWWCNSYYMIIIYYNSPVPTRHQQRPVPFSTLFMWGKTVPGSLPAGASLSPIQGAVHNLARSSSTYYPLVISHSYGSDGPLIDDLPKYYNMYIYIYIRKHIHEQPLKTTIYYISYHPSVWWRHSKFTDHQLPSAAAGVRRGPKPQRGRCSGNLRWRSFLFLLGDLGIKMIKQ